MTKDSANRPPADSFAPSPWVRRFAPLVPAGGEVLDLACGAGRHSRLFAERGHRVIAVDLDVSRLGAIAEDPRVEVIAQDLESHGAEGPPFPPEGRRFAGVVVANYLYRPLLPRLVAAVSPGGAFIYETFARGNERFARPRNPAHLLEPGELLEAVMGRLRIVAYEDLLVKSPRPGAVQRIAAIRADSAPLV
jgi:SAM-dependent methyltransferase